MSKSNTYQNKDAQKIGAFLIDSDADNKRNAISERFSQLIVAKVIDWVLRERVIEGAYSAFQWNKNDRQLLNQMIDNPEAAGLDLPVKNSKFKKFFKSIASNGLNTVDIQLFYTYRKKLPLRELGWEFNTNDFIFIDKKYISKERIPAGFYMMEIGQNLNPYSPQPILICRAQNIKDSESQNLRLTSNRICKRLIYLEDESKFEMETSIKLEPKKIYHFRLAKLTRNFFLSRMLTKIGKQFNLNKLESLSLEEFYNSWTKYNSIFGANVHGNYSDFDNYIKALEAEQIPSREEQLKIIN